MRHARMRFANLKKIAIIYSDKRKYTSFRTFKKLLIGILYLNSGN